VIEDEVHEEVGSMLNAEEIEEIKKTGLLVSVVSSGPYKGGYNIAKPKSIPGNTRENWEVFFGPDEIECDSPCAHVYPKENKWIFEIWESVPGPGPGDFREEYRSASEAIDSVLDYYFGGSEKMNPPEL
jgi:hypothetical protein